MICSDDLPEDVRPILCNGMGPRGGFVFWLLWLFLIVIRVGVYFRAASDNHDVRCFAGGTEFDRAKVSRAFLGEMLDAVERFSGWRRRYARFFALRAYELSNEFEDDLGSWKYRDEPLTLSEVVGLARRGEVS